MKKSLALLWPVLGLFACSGDPGAEDGADGETATGGTSPSGGTSTGGQGGLGGDAATGGQTNTGGTPLATTPGGIAGAPPSTWTEHWFEHVQEMALVDYDDWVAVYADADVNRDQIGWMMPFFHDLWQYTVTHYGQFTDGTRDGRVYMLFHQGRYSGGHPSTYFDASHDYRNVSDVGPGPHAIGSYGIPVHEVAHIVELASRGYHGSPAFGIWGDSKWAEFYTYDIYVGLGMEAEAQQAYDDYIVKSDDFPEGHTTFWFRDWFYPLWRDYGHVEVMANYFRLVAEHWDGGGMNVGEYVHFTSGAAGTDLKALATTAFGWSEAREAEYAQAKLDYPELTY
ncbi:MAG TPA: hypothetical protein VLC09_19475 [Polyangiaceae bacterium]|nr:hypothetical protein [Polyangiaceae bacterium]